MEERTRKRQARLSTVARIAAREGSQQLAEMAVQTAVAAICPEADVQAIVDVGLMLWGAIRKAWSLRSRTRHNDEG